MGSTARKQWIAGLLILMFGPLFVSGVIELLDLGRVRSRVTPPPPLLNFELVKSGDTYTLLDRDQLNDQCIAMVTFDPLERDEYDTRFLCPTRVITSRRLDVLFYDPNRTPTAEELRDIRAAVIEQVKASGGSRELIAELGRPNINERGINWPGVYVNGLIGMVTIAMAGVIVWIPIRELSPAARRRRRTAIGHCPECDYDLRGAANAGCPECGWRKPSGEAGDRV